LGDLCCRRAGAGDSGRITQPICPHSDWTSLPESLFRASVATLPEEERVRDGANSSSSSAASASRVKA
jgi:hypothetical protein